MVVAAVLVAVTVVEVAAATAAVIVVLVIVEVVKVVADASVTLLSSNSQRGRVTHSNPAGGSSWYPPCHPCGPCCTHCPLPLLLLLPTDWSP